MIILKVICIDYQRIIQTNAMKYARWDKHQSIYYWTANIIKQNSYSLKQKHSSKTWTLYWCYLSSRLKELQC